MMIAIPEYQTPQAIRSIDINDLADLHHSTVVSMSHADVPRVKEILIKSIEECRSVIRESKEEKILSKVLHQDLAAYPFAGYFLN